MSRPERKIVESKARERRAFSAEFKQEAVRSMYERRAAGVRLSQIARDLELRPEQLRQWGHQFREQNGGTLPGVVETPAQELKRLRREVIVLRQEQAFAKKVAVYFAKESR
jgi:transposase-like protein